MAEHNKAFKEKVLENKMFDSYDKNIILSHLSNFYCVFQLGWDAIDELYKKEIDNIRTEFENDKYNAYNYDRGFEELEQRMKKLKGEK